jgi:uncharacterized protein
VPLDGGIGAIVLKVAELCNLNCSYCYLYQHEDTSYRARPKFMSERVFDQTILRLRDYCDRRAPHSVAITFHGGEPTLIGPAWIAWAAVRAREILGPRLDGLILQTNGTLLDQAWMSTLEQHDIRTSVSLDGPPEVHDAVRVDHDDRGSYVAAIRGLRLLQDTGLDPSVLCVIAPFASGLATYRHFRSLGIMRMSFLLPDVSHDNKQRLYARYGPTPVADYLIPVFDDWFAEDDPEIQIGLFWELIAMMRGGQPRTDAFGNPLMSYLIVETDGSIHANDALRVCDENVSSSGLNVFEHEFDQLHLGLPLVHRLVHEGLALSATCNACVERTICGGGHPPHRYARANGFDNPSVWCADILKLLSHIRTRLGDAAVA